MKTLKAFDDVPKKSLPVKPDPHNMNQLNVGQQIHGNIRVGNQGNGEVLLDGQHNRILITDGVDNRIVIGNV